MKISRSVTFFIATLLMYLGWPLLGWGVGGFREFFLSAPRLGYAIAVIMFSLAVGTQAYNSAEGIRGKQGQAGKLVIRQTVVRYVLVLSMYVALFFIPFFDRRGIGTFKDVETLRWLGVALSTLGYGMIFWSGVALGRQYSADVTIQDSHQLIMNSVYRYIRHPRYLGAVALSMGVSFVFRSWIGLVVSVYFLAMLIYRIQDEEATMHKEFGAEWEAYCKRSWRLIPYVF